MKVRNRRKMVLNPFVSEAQRRACYAKDDPNWDCREWSVATGKRTLPKRKPTTNRKAPNPLRIDPTRTATLRRAFQAQLRRQFALLKGRIVKLLVEEDALGLKDRTKDTSSSVFNCQPGQMRGSDGRCGPGISLGISREDMPQIKTEDIGQFVSYAAAVGVLVTEELANASALSPTQVEFRQERVDSIPKEKLNEPILVSSDDYILDGTHRWVKHWQGDRWASVPVLKVGLPVRQAIQLMRSFPKSNFTSNEAEVHRILQSKPWACGAAVVSALTGWDQEEAKTILGTTKKDGTTPEAIASALGTAATEGMSIQQLQEATDDGTPVVCAIQAWGSDAAKDDNRTGHYVIVTKVDDYSVHFMDPAVGRERQLSLHEFELVWHDEDKDGNEWNQLGIVANSNPEGCNQYKPCGGGSYHSQALEAIRGLKAKIAGTLSDYVDKVPGGKALREKLAGLNDKLAERYGLSTAKTILASAQAISWGAFTAGLATGHTIYVPSWGLTVVGAVLAEGYLQAHRGVKKLTGNEAVDIDGEAQKLYDELVNSYMPGGGGHDDPLSTPVGNSNPEGHNQYTGRTAVKPTNEQVQKAIHDDKWGPYRNHTYTLHPVDVDVIEPTHKLGFDDSVKYHKEMFDTGKPVTPIVITESGNIIGGHHRHEAAKRSGLKRIWALVRHDPVTNTRWQFNTDPEKLRAFQAWLKAQLESTIQGQTQHQLWDKYIQDGFRKGAGRSFDDVRYAQKAQSAGNLRKLDFYDGTRDEFLRSSFAQPVAKEKVELLASRAWDELDGMSGDMANKLGRALTDGLVQGKGPHEVARDLVKQVDISRNRAELISRTELIRAHAEGQLVALKSLGVDEIGVMVEFTVTEDEVLCPQCEALAGSVFKIDDAHGLIPAHPGCRCAFLPAGVGETLNSLILYNIFCATGAGGGVDPSCSKEGSGELLKFVSDWTSGTGEVSKKGANVFDVIKPTAEVIKETSEARPKQAVILFRSHRIGAKHEDYESWTPHREMAEMMTEGDNGREVLVRRFDPSEILFSSDHLPSNILEEHAIAGEVVVATGKATKKMADLRGEKVQRGQFGQGDPISQWIKAGALSANTRLGGSLQQFEMAYNIFCATGKGGGRDATCSKFSIGKKSIWAQRAAGKRGKASSKQPIKKAPIKAKVETTKVAKVEKKPPVKVEKLADKPAKFVLPPKEPVVKETPRGNRPGDGGRRVEAPPPVVSRPVAPQAERPQPPAAAKGGEPNPQPSGDRVTPTVSPVAANKEVVQARIDRFEQFFRSKGDHQTAEWMGKLREHVEKVGTTEALRSLGNPTKAAAGSDDGTLYTGGWDSMGHFAESYLGRHGIVPVHKADQMGSPNRVIGSESLRRGAEVAHADALEASGGNVAHADKAKSDYLKSEASKEYHFRPQDPNLPHKLAEAKALPGLERSEDVNHLLGHSVTHLTKEVMSKLDEHYGKGRWVVKPYQDEAFNSQGVYFPQRAQQIGEDARGTLHSANGELEKHGFSLQRNDSGQVVGIRHTSGDEYHFGSEKYNNTIYGHVREWGDKAAAASQHERGAKLPTTDEGRTWAMMAQPAFEAVGVSDADRAGGKTIAPGEGRVHVVTRDGKAEVIPHTTWIKNEHLPVVFENDDTRAMAKAAVDAINALPKSERQGQIYAPDVIKAKGGYKVVEANPANDTGSSGYLGNNPLVIDSYVSYLTGREPAHVKFIRKLLSSKTENYRPAPFIL